MSVSLTANGAAVRALLSRGESRAELASLRAVLGPAAGRVLAHDPDAGYLAADCSAHYGLKTALRSLLALPGLVLFFDLLAADEVSWSVDRFASRPLWRSRETNELRLLHAAGDRDAEALTGFDLAGVRSGVDCALFHTESQLAASALSFDCAGEGRLRFLLAGLAPGSWDVWRNGWLEHGQVRVPAPACTLRFEGRPGGYFLRKL
ncbi:MAG TPA: hypothetical protein DEH78_18695 [Solibacterales bacterium]|nr:hypothetical protein [Bryobacterales bacterium]